MSTSMIASLFVLLLAFPYAFAIDFTVGDASGWTEGVDYINWASGKTFKVGDNLVFNYDSLHQVDEVSESDYKSCTSSNNIEKYAHGNSKVALTKTGKIYYICPTPGYCASGMKFEVNVVAASTTPTPSGTPPPTKSPSGTPPTIPSPPVAEPEILTSGGTIYIICNIK